MGIDYLIALRDEYRRATGVYPPHAAPPNETKEEYKERYHRYLQSNEWFTKRQKVFDRDQYICQGCLSRPATQVHHVTYDNVFNEFLWELVSICDHCHKRKHKITTTN